MNLSTKLAGLAASFAVLTACASLGQAQESAKLDPQNATDAQTLMRKIQC